MTIYDQNLDANPANFVVLSAVSVLSWVVMVYVNKAAGSHIDQGVTRSEVCCRSANTPKMFAGHYAVPMARGR